MHLRDRHHAHQLEWQAFEFQIRVTSTESMCLKYTTCVFKVHNHVYLIYTAKRGIFKSESYVIHFNGLMMLPRPRTGEVNGVRIGHFGAVVGVDTNIIGSKHSHP